MSVDAMAAVPPAAPPSMVHHPRVAAPDVPEGDVPATLLGLAGLGVLGLLAGLGSGEPGMTWRMLSMLPVATVGAAALTAPMLLAAGPTLHLHLEGQDVVRALAAGTAHAGRLAWALVPLTLFVGATSDAGLGVYLACAALVGVQGLRVAHQRLLLAAAAPRVPHAARLTFGVWRVLATLIGMRLLAYAMSAS